MQDPEDARSVRVRLKDEGRWLIDTAAGAFEDELGGILAALSLAERAQWVELTDRLLAAEAEGRPGPSV